MWYLGGQTIVAAGWVGPRAVYVDFVSEYTSGWHWQLYAGRTLIGVTAASTSRQVVGQLVVDDAPAPLTLVRVDAANRTTNYGDLIPRQPWNRYALAWTASSYPADADHFQITGSPAAGEAVSDDNVIARVPFRGDGDYRFALPPLATAGEWDFRITPRDNALPSGNAGTPTDVSITAEIPPADLPLDDGGNRFTLAVEAGDLVAAFSYPE